MKAMFHEKLDGFVGDIHHSPNIRASTPSLIQVKKTVHTWIRQPPKDVEVKPH